MTPLSSDFSCITLNLVGDSQSYYGDSQNFMVKEFSQYEELEEIVGLASQPIPERPDGIVCVAKYSSASRKECRPTEPEYERLARDNPATVFLRCFEEYEGADLLFGQASVQNFPTYDVFYGGNRVARVEGSNISELQDVLSMYQLQNSQLDLFSEEATYKRKAQWGDGSAANMAKTPKTTNRFIPGYDWGSDRGFFDDQGDKAQQSFEDSFGNWLPNMEDE